MKKATAHPTGRMGTPAKDINEYLSRVPPGSRALLQKLRKIIKAAAPKAVEVISYGIPAFRYQGQLVFFAAYRDHCSLFAGKGIMKTFERELKAFKGSTATIHFTVAHPLPATLVRKIIKAKIQENELRVKRTGK